MSLEVAADLLGKRYLAQQKTPRSRVFRPILQLRVRLLPAQADGTIPGHLRHTARFTTGIARGYEPTLGRGLRDLNRATAAAA